MSSVLSLSTLVDGQCATKLAAKVGEVAEALASEFAVPTIPASRAMLTVSATRAMHGTNVQPKLCGTPLNLDGLNASHLLCADTMFVCRSGKVLKRVCTFCAISCWHAKVQRLLGMHDQTL